MALLTLHATHAVIFRVISGGLWSPNCSRSADTGTEEDPLMAQKTMLHVLVSQSLSTSSHHESSVKQLHNLQITSIYLLHCMSALGEKSRPDSISR